MPDPRLDALPDQEDAAGPVFSEPWQAQAFAMAVALSERGVFTWSEWAATLAAEIAAAERAGDPCLGDTYYKHWLSALEKLVADKGLATASALSARRQAWAEAAEAAPHGEPIALAAAARTQEAGP